MKPLETVMDICANTITEHYTFAKIISRRFCSKIGFDFTEDIEAEGFVGLVKAANSYKISKKLTFKSWAAFKIRSEIQGYIGYKYKTKKGRAEKIAIKIAINELDFIYEASPSRFEKDFCNRDLIRELMKSIPSTWQEVIFLYYIRGYTLREIGEMKGYTKANASRLRTRAIEKMNKALKRVEAR